MKEISLNRKYGHAGHTFDTEDQAKVWLLCHGFEKKNDVWYNSTRPAYITKCTEGWLAHIHQELK